ncbi:YciE/YciF ferroxidase family protein [Mesorhizobium caraganae]|uniref:YciE/YciF ferroxidase family protein n=1 Tax=Mesorhizobium caraganae TaxID=483206 RepID=UPI00289BA53B|nr:DUF892 family protein [Mesorhizobium caraganae]
MNSNATGAQNASPDDKCMGHAACQAIEHYEISRYGSLREWAKDLGHDEAHKLLSEILDQEKATNNKLTNLAVTLINRTN